MPELSAITEMLFLPVRPVFFRGYNELRLGVEHYAGDNCYWPLVKGCNLMRHGPPLVYQIKEPDTFLRHATMSLCTQTIVPLRMLLWAKDDALQFAIGACEHAGLSRMQTAHVVALAAGKAIGVGFRYPDVRALWSFVRFAAYAAVDLMVTRVYEEGQPIRDVGHNERNWQKERVLEHFGVAWYPGGEP